MLLIQHKFCNEINMGRVHRFIEEEHLRFNMACWLMPVDESFDEMAGPATSCYTAACIGGTAALLYAQEHKRKVSRIHEHSVGEWLGIDCRQQERLFYCAGDGEPSYLSGLTQYRMSRVTRPQGLEAICNLAKDGQPHWQDICSDIDAEFERIGRPYTGALR